MTLVTIAPGKQLEAAPAASYRRARAAGCPAGVTSAYRSRQAQAVLRARYLANPKTVAYAAPVDQSEHVTGHALDLPAGGPREWFAAHGRAYGWIRTDPRESWHYAYRLALDTHLTDGTAPPAPPQPPPQPTPQEDEDMPTVVHAGTAGSYLLDGGVLLPLDLAALAEAQRAGFKAIGISRDLYLQWARAGHPEAVMIRDAGSGSIALAVGGSQFEPVPDMTTYADLLAQGIPVRSVTAAMYAALTTKEES